MYCADRNQCCRPIKTASILRYRVDIRLSEHDKAKDDMAKVFVEDRYGLRKTGKKCCCGYFRLQPLEYLM